MIIGVLTPVSINVISCSPSQAKKLINKIKNTKIHVPYSDKTDASEEPNPTSIDKALQTANPTLTSNDLKNLSYTGTLKLEEKATITATAKISGTTATINLGITMEAKTSHDILGDITNPNLTVAYNLNPNADHNRNHISTALQKANPTLTKHDLTRLSYSGTLNPGGNADIKVTVDKSQQELTLLSWGSSW